MPANGTANLIPFTKNDPRRINKPVGAISHEKRLRMAARVAQKLTGKEPIDIYACKRAYEKDGVLMKVLDKLYPNATPEKELDEVKTNKVEVYIEFGTANIQNQAQRSSGEGNFLDIEASAMSPKQS